MWLHTRYRIVRAVTTHRSVRSLNVSSKRVACIVSKYGIFLSHLQQAIAQEPSLTRCTGWGTL